MKKVILYTILVFSLLSCEREFTNKINESIKCKLSSLGIDSESQINRLDVYAMTDGRLVKEYINVSAESSGLYPINIDQKENTVLLFVANGDNVPFDQIEGSTTHAEMLSTSTPVADYLLAQPTMYYTGSNNITPITEPTILVDMTRSLARLDLKIQAETDIIIDSCVISNIVDRAHILPSENLLHSDAKLISTTLSGDQLTATSTTIQEGFIYLYESDNANSKVVFYGKINGVKNILEVSLPTQINRNEKYMITINSQGATLYGTLVTLPWDEGLDLDAHPKPFAPLIDIVNSSFSSVVNFSKTRDTIFLPAISTTGILVIDADSETELMTDSDITIQPISPSSKVSYVGNKFTLSVESKDINDKISYSRIYVKDKNASQVYDRYIVVAQYPYRTSFPDLHERGEVKGFDIDFNGYIDGKIANFESSEEPLDVTCETSDPDFNWLKIDKMEPLITEIHGFFKPNDAEAKGQNQESRIKVTYKDGLIEEFKFTRKRESIPSVFIAGRHWAKHNMRGNSKKYEDQISIVKDLDDTFEYLKTCSVDEYIYYSGANYKGRSQEGMYLHKDIINNVLNYKGYSLYASGDLSNASPELHCPSGYQVPTLKEIGAILHETGRFGLIPDGSPVEYTSSSNIRFIIERHIRDFITIDGIIVPNVMHTKITEKLTKVSLALTGMGHQFSPTGISYHSVIMGIINPNGGKYFTFDHTGNYATVQAHNSSKTRVIRCVKTAVKHLIE